MPLRCTLPLVLILLLLLPATARADQTQEVVEFLGHLSQRLAANDWEGAMGYVVARPEQAALAFRLGLASLEQQTDQEAGHNTVLALNFLARTFEVRLGRRDLAEELSRRGMLLEASAWEGTPLGAAPRPTPTASAGDPEARALLGTLAELLARGDRSGAARAAQEAPPARLTAAFRLLLEAWGKSTDAEDKRAGQFLLNLLARVRERQGGPLDLSLELQRRGLLLDSSTWVGTPLAAEGVMAELETADILARLGAYDAAVDRYQAILDALQKRIKALSAGGLEALPPLMQHLGVVVMILSRVAAVMEQMDLTLAGGQYLDQALAALAELETLEKQAEGLLDLREIREPLLDVKVTVLLGKARSARIFGRPDEAARLYRQVDELAARGATPTAFLARYLAATFLYDLELERQGAPPAFADFKKRHDEAEAFLARIPGDAPLAPGEVLRLGEGMRTWMERGIACAIRLQGQGQGQDYLQLSLGGLYRLGELMKSNQGRNTEYIFASIRTVLNLLGQAREVLGPEAMEPLLEQCRELLGMMDAAMKEISQAYGRPVESVELRRLYTRFHLERARVLLLKARGNAASPLAAQALQEYEKALQAAESGSLALETIDIGNEYALLVIDRGAAPSVSARLEQSLQASRNLQYRPGLIGSLAARGELRAAGGQRQEAIQDLQEAVGLTEQYITELGATGEAAELIRARARRAYELLARLQIEAGQGQEAFATLSRAQQLRTQVTLDPGTIQTRDPVLRSAQEKLQSAREQSRVLEQQLANPAVAANPAERQRVQKLLASSKAEFYQALEQIRASDETGYRSLQFRPANFASIQKSIPANAVLVQLFPARDRLYLFVVTAESFRIRSVEAPRAEIEALVGRFREQIARYMRRAEQGPAPSSWSWSDPAAAPLRSVLVELHRLLVDPIEEDIKDREVVAFLPTGQLFYMPLQAVARPTADGGLEFLIQRKQVVVLAKAADVFRLERKDAAGTARLLALGNPDGTLDSAAEEARALGQMFPGSQVYLREQATKEKLLASAAGVEYLHLATHGVLDSQEPLASYVLLAGSGEEGKLRVSEIAGLNLEKTRLVTLSACETGLAQETLEPGSDVTSLADAFNYAGSPSLVASLWSVSDESTQELMVAFYEGLRQGQSRGQSLQRAQLKLLAQPRFAHPFYWAPFILVGDWR